MDDGVHLRGEVRKQKCIVAQLELVVVHEQWIEFGDVKYIEFGLHRLVLSLSDLVALIFLILRLPDLFLILSLSDLVVLTFDDLLFSALLSTFSRFSLSYLPMTLTISQRQSYDYTQR